MNCSHDWKCRGDEILSPRQSFSLVHAVGFVPGECHSDISPELDASCVLASRLFSTGETLISKSNLNWTDFSSRTRKTKEKVPSRDNIYRVEKKSSLNFHQANEEKRDIITLLVNLSRRETY